MTLPRTSETHALQREQARLLASVDLDDLLDRAAAFCLTAQEKAVVHRLAQLQHLMHTEGLRDESRSPSRS